MRANASGGGGGVFQCMGLDRGGKHSGPPLLGAHTHTHIHTKERQSRGRLGGRCLSQRSHGEHDTASKRQETTRGFMKTYRLLINTHARIHSCPVVAIFAGSRDQSSRRCLPPLPLARSPWRRRAVPMMLSVSKYEAVVQPGLF